jgi:uncharacterized protein (DUF427 family)
MPQDHPIRIVPNPNRVRVRLGDKLVVDTKRALTLFEASYPGVQYVPRDDADMSLMRRTAHKTHCPYKGDAAYFTILMDGQFAENAVWTYETPFPAMEAIAGRLSFYPDKVEVYSVDEAAVNPEAHPEPSPQITPEPRAASVDEVIQHTDAGDGTSQREHWTPNVKPPATTDDGGLR